MWTFEKFQKCNLVIGTFKKFQKCNLAKFKSNGISTDGFDSDEMRSHYNYLVLENILRISTSSLKRGLINLIDSFLKYILKIAWSRVIHFWDCIIYMNVSFASYKLPYLTCQILIGVGFFFIKMNFETSRDDELRSHLNSDF